MKVGFTGTKLGCTVEQKASLKALLYSLSMAEFHHGDCIGADAQAHYLVGRSTYIVIHPAIVHSSNRAFFKGSYHTHEPKPPLERNRDIVDDSEILVACPKSDGEEQRSGTWMTVRYAREIGRNVIIVWPNGSVTREERGDRRPT